MKDFDKTKEKSDSFHCKIETKDEKGVVKIVYVKLTQIRVISNRRLLRKFR